MNGWITVTAACPVQMLAAANHLAMALGRSIEDAGTYGTASWQDGAGNLYAVASWSIPAEWINAAQSPLSRPAWDSHGDVDMDAAAQVQATMRVSLDPVPAQPDRLTVILLMDGLSAVKAMGLDVYAP